MIPGQPALRFIFVFLLLLRVFSAAAQPTLPEVAGSADKGVVILSWVCQYDKVKSIAVMRSLDSTKINQNIGFVKMVDKGLQAFADAHPEAGRNFYKLIIQFKSGLSWSSNRVGVNVDKTMLEQSKHTLPVNDSLQHFVITEEMTDIGKTNSSVPAQPVKSGSVSPSGDTARKHKVLISFEFDTSAVNEQALAANANRIAPPRKKITVAFDDQGSSVPVAVVSKLIFTEPETGHVRMNLPEDILSHHYSVKFYNERNIMIFEVPKISLPKIIIDKRNFQKRGIYKFVIRRDVVELESGYVHVIP